MFALRSGQVRRMGSAKPGLFGMSFSIDGFVLPRLLRRPVRLFARLGQGDFTPPPFSATIASAIFLSASGLYGAYVGGHMPALVQGITARSGFAVDQIKVVGHRETSEIDVLDKLELDGWTSLIGFDADEARERIAKLPWVEVASVRKIYPNTLEVKIEERKAFAIWQHGSQLSIVEENGNVIAPFSGGRHVALPLVVGYGAAECASGFIAKIKQFPELASRVKGYVRVSERRWDLRLENGITVKLPEYGEDTALADLVKMDHDTGLLSRDIAGVDMRLSDRLVVQLTPEAVERREAALKELLKSPKSKLEKRI
ncbi:cell division protein FtsQ/DivIB [Mesorhizobium sp. CGMCC 1.15528]|uniref:Cell division protein FtsQ n=1 Tax=Mesorhizobium zhangyense TaxID=1776730 RepID=A0A7C9VAY0_9HYPH|nr:cell division protein FtsQ/DivIB [Mesorhizobium zhangyense]NGN40989.1 cell division protein FtsQ/DivIB [Mesorhizobium zhangyense]